MTNSARKLARPGHRTQWLPNQHGAWAMLASPVLLGWMAGGIRWVHLPLTLAWFIGFMWFFSTSQWLKSRFHKRYRLPVLVYGAVAAGCAASAVILDWRLVYWVPAFLPWVLLALWQSWKRLDRSVVAGMSTVIAASLMTWVVAWSGGGSITNTVTGVALLNAAYLSGTLLYVKSCIRERNNKKFRLFSVLWHVIWAPILYQFSLISVVMVGILAVRAWVIPARGWRPKKVGLAEMVFHIAVVAVAATMIWG